MIWVLSAVGMCWALRVGKAKWLTNILLCFEFFQKMLACAFCTGFHCGYACYFVWDLPGLSLFLIPQLFVAGLAGGTASLIFDILEQNFE